MKIITTRNRGMTLIELVLNILIIAMVTLLLFSFLKFNYNTIDKSNMKYDLMTSLSNVQKRVEKELKYADNINLYSNEEFEEKIKNPDSLDEINNLIYLKEKQIILQKSGIEYQLSDSKFVLIDKLEFQLDGKLFHVIIEGESTDGKQVHEIDYYIELLNIKGSKNMNGSIVEYSTYKGDD